MHNHIPIRIENSSVLLITPTSIVSEKSRRKEEKLNNTSCKLGLNISKRAETLSSAKKCLLFWLEVVDPSLSFLVANFSQCPFQQWLSLTEAASNSHNDELVDIIPNNVQLPKSFILMAAKRPPIHRMDAQREGIVAREVQKTVLLRQSLRCPCKHVKMLHCPSICFPEALLQLAV